MAKVSFEGIGEMMVTFLAEEGLTSGPVKMTGDGKVGPCGDGDAFCGVALEPRGGCAAVQVGGFATVQVSGEGVSAGMVKLSADGSGGVKLDAANGAEYLVAAVDSAAGTAAVLL